MLSEDKATTVARKRYDRFALFYDASEAITERLRYGGWRKELWSKVEGPSVLEIGVGTGKSFP